MAPDSGTRWESRRWSLGTGGYARRGAAPEPQHRGGKGQIRKILTRLPPGVEARAKKPTKMAKVSEVLQKPSEESPADFYERLCEAFRVYTPFDPEAPENKCMVNAAFVGKAQSDIRQKLQKLEGFPGKNATELLEIANKISVN